MKSFLTVVFISLFLTPSLSVFAKQAQLSPMKCSQGSISIPDNNGIFQIKSDCTEVNIAGNNNLIYSGNIQSLVLMGDGNTIFSGTLNKVIATGNKNSIAFLGTDPKYSFMGDGNKLLPNGLEKRQVTKKVKPRVVKKSKPKTAKVKSKPKRKVISTKGTAKSQLHRVLYNGALNRFNVIVLLKDGTAVLNPKIPIEHLNIKQHKRANPKRWRQWRGKGDNIQTRPLAGGQWKKLRSKHKKTLRSGKKGMVLSGKWKHASTTGFGGSSFFANYVFTRDGRFESSKSSLMTGGVPGISSSGAISNCNKKGQSSVSSSTSVGGTASSSRQGKGCGKANVGRYFVNGYTIEFHAEDGKLYRQPFYYMDKDTLIIGKRWFAGNLN